MIPKDYLERVYSGVLGKMIGVYLGRPFEGWTYEKITTELGQITNYVHEKLDMPLIVTDDDLTGTFNQSSLAASVSMGSHSSRTISSEVILWPMLLSSRLFLWVVSLTNII